MIKSTEILELAELIKTRDRARKILCALGGVGMMKSDALQLVSKKELYAAVEMYFDDMLAHCEMYLEERGVDVEA